VGETERGQEVITMGVDPASYVTGLAVINDGFLVHAEAWRRDRKAELEENLFSLSSLVNNVCHEHDVEQVCIERVSVSYSMKTVRLIAYFEAAAAIGASLCGIPCTWMTPSEARKLATGFGGNKEQALEWAKLTLKGQSVDMVEDELEAFVMARALEARLT